MKNLETPSTKLALHGVQTDVGSALMLEALHRQYEVTAIVDDLNGITARPGVRTKLGDGNDAVSVQHSAAGMNAVACVLPWSSTDGDAALSILALLEGLERAGVKRLLLIGDFSWLDLGPETTSDHLQHRLTNSQIGWTLIQAPHQADATELQRFAAGALDELELCLHVHCRLHLIDQKDTAPAGMAGDSGATIRS